MQVEKTYLGRSPSLLPGVVQQPVGLVGVVGCPSIWSIFSFREGNNMTFLLFSLLLNLASAWLLCLYGCGVGVVAAMLCRMSKSPTNRAKEVFPFVDNLLVVVAYGNLLF